MVEHTPAIVTDQHWSVKTAIEQIEACNFECEAGPLANNVGWKWLLAAAEAGPEFMPGQGVWFKICATAAGKELHQWAHFYIVGCGMTSDTERRLWIYDLSFDPPSPWHYGTVHFYGISADKLRLEKPSEAPHEGHARPIDAAIARATPTAEGVA